MTETINSEVTMTLKEAVLETLSILTGQTLRYDPDKDRFRAVTLALNRALRSNALEANWSYYSTVVRIDLTGREGHQRFPIVTDFRFRIIGDDAVRILSHLQHDASKDSAQDLADDLNRNSDHYTAHEVPVAWAYFLPRDALHKYRNRGGLWCSVTREVLTLSRPLPPPADGLTMEIPVMREPRLFKLPADPTVEADPIVLAQELDFDFPDVVTGRAAWLYAQTDPLMQPRVQTLEEQYKNLMYQLIERDTAFTDTPYQNEILVPVQGDIYGDSNRFRWPVSNRP